jgi:uncharacterized protein YceK
MGYLIGFISFLLLIIISGCGTIYKPVDQKFDIPEPTVQSYIENTVDCNDFSSWRGPNESRPCHRTVFDTKENSR